MSKIPPHFPEGERAIIASCLLDNRCISKVREAISCDDFYNTANKDLFACIDALSDRNVPVDLVSLTAAVKATGSLESIGGSEYLVDLVDTAASPANVMHYAKLVGEKASLRRIISSATEIASRAYQDQANLSDVVEAFQTAAFDHAMHGQRAGKGLRPVAEIISPTIEAIKDAKHTGLPSGFRNIDRYTRGFRPGELIVIGARPSVGKSALAADFLVEAVKHGPAAFFSLEMSAPEVTMRFLSKASRLNLHSLRGGDLGHGEWSRLMTSAGELEDFPLYLDDSGSLIVSRMKGRLREVMTRGHTRIRLVVVDYLQLVRPEGKHQSRNEEIGSLTRSLKLLAKELMVPVVCLSQLNRKLEERPFKGHERRPRMADFRDSGSIEQDADIIIGLYRPEIYAPNDPQYHGIAEAIILKQRNGPVGIAGLAWEASTATFRDLAPKSMSDL